MSDTINVSLPHTTAPPYEWSNCAFKDMGEGLVDDLLILLEIWCLV